jgi:phage terminase small subunit
MAEELRQTCPSEARECMPLTDRQQRFVEEYLVDLNATAAYKRAGYKAQGRSAENAASRLLGNVGVREAIAAAQAKRSEKVELTQQWVVERLIVEAQGQGQDTSPGARISALKLLGQHQGMFGDEDVMRALEDLRRQLDALEGKASAGGGGKPAASS